jgi:hypothetical protein
MLYALFKSACVFRLLGTNRKYSPLYNRGDDAELECRQTCRTTITRF